MESPATDVRIGDFAPSRLTLWKTALFLGVLALAVFWLGRRPLKSLEAVESVEEATADESSDELGDSTAEESSEELREEPPEILPRMQKEEAVAPSNVRK